jgi:hypothetical protein
MQPRQYIPAQRPQRRLPIGLPATAIKIPARVMDVGPYLIPMTDAMQLERENEVADPRADSLDAFEPRHQLFTVRGLKQHVAFNEPEHALDSSQRCVAVAPMSKQEVCRGGKGITNALPRGWR